MKFLAIWLSLINLIGFAAFGLDKYKAIHNKWRIRESILLLFAFLGGSPGCLLGMYLFHHKTRHKKFTITIPIILVLELILGCAVYTYYWNHLPYNYTPQKLVEHELSLLTSPDTYNTIPDELKTVFDDFFKSFSYEIHDVKRDGDTAQVRVSLSTLDGKSLAKEYSRQAMIKQIQNTANPSNVDFSLEDCYLLLGTVLKEFSFPRVTSEYTVALTRKDKAWSFSSPGSFESALTGQFASYVSDAYLFTPSEIISIHLDTLKNFDTEQLSRYLALDTIFSGDAEYKRTISRALASQLLTYLDYSITSETISEDGTTASVELEVTSCDSHSMMTQYQENVRKYTQTSQALEDGISGRLNKANDILVSCISGNTATTTTRFAIQLTNDGTNWKLKMSDEMSEALLGNINVAIQEVSDQLQQ